MNVFISYSTHDIEFARSVAFALQNYGFQTFLAEESWRPGQDHDHLRKALRAAHMVVLIWSGNAAASQWVLQEIGGTWARNGMLIPVRVDDTPLPDTLRAIKYIDARANTTDAILHIQRTAIAVCNDLLRRQGRAAAIRRKQIEQYRAKQAQSALVCAVGGAALMTILSANR